MKKLLLFFIASIFVVSCGNAERKMAYESANYRLAEDLHTEFVKEGLTRQVLCYNDDIMLVRVIFGEEMVGQRPAPHSHPHSQSSYILSGKFEFHCGDKVQILKEGDSFYVEPNTPHEAYCLEPGIIIDGFSPIREDFLSVK